LVKGSLSDIFFGKGCRFDNKRSHQVFKNIETNLSEICPAWKNQSCQGWKPMEGASIRITSIFKNFRKVNGNQKRQGRTTIKVAQ